MLTINFNVYGQKCNGYNNPITIDGISYTKECINSISTSYSGDKIYIYSGDVTHSGSITLNDNAILFIDSDNADTGGSLSLTGWSPIKLNNNSKLIVTENLNNPDGIDINGTSQVYVGGDLTIVDQTFSNAGGIVVAGNFTTNANINNENGALMDIEGSLTMTGDRLFNNQGEVNIKGSFSNVGKLSNGSGSNSSASFIVANDYGTKGIENYGNLEISGDVNTRDTAINNYGTGTLLIEGDVTSLNHIYNSGDMRAGGTISSSYTNGGTPNQCADPDDPGSCSLVTSTDNLSITNSSTYQDVQDILSGLGISVLPIDLIYFNSTLSQSHIKLDWSTASEENSSYFEIQRSNSLKTFETIGRVESNGNSSSRIDYTFTDEKPLGGNITYRLKQVDINGTYRFYTTTVVNNTKKLVFNYASSNPLREGEDLKLNVYMPKEQNIWIQIYNTEGKVLFQRHTKVKQGHHLVSVPSQDLNGHLLYVNLSVDSERKTFKVLRQ